ncbi:MAG TPA: hypothetical protein VNB91_04075 [Jatrophihabitantaceae bacterium]|nr:hypothetical protein [Jatrophihabitantaceae bacterium]
MRSTVSPREHRTGADREACPQRIPSTACNDHQSARHLRVQQPVHAAVQIKDERRFLYASPH